MIGDADPGGSSSAPKAVRSFKPSITPRAGMSSAWLVPTPECARPRVVCITSQRDGRIAEIWIFEADQYAVDAMFGA